jgi:ABC-2 type transport system permease protein
MNNPISHYQLYHLVVAHFKEVIRQPAVIFWGIIFPILIALGLGLAFTQQTESVYRVGVAAGRTDMAQQEPAVLRFLQERGRRLDPTEKGSTWQLTLEDSRSGNTRFLFTQTDWDSAIVQIKRGKLNLIVEPAPDGRIQYHFDPRNPEAELAYLKLSAAVESGTGPETDSNDPVVPLTVTGTRYIDFLVPGLICLGVMMSCMWGVSYGMIDKRSKKLLRRLVATPMKKSHFLVALMTVRIAMNLIEAVLLFIFASLVFDIAVQGSIAALAAIFLAGNIAFCGIAIFTSSRTANTEVGNGLVNAVVMPMTVLSGIFFSYHNFPDWSIAFIQKLPLTLFADGIRAIFNEGGGFAETGLAVAVLTAVGVIFFSLGLRIFRWH